MKLSTCLILTLIFTLILVEFVFAQPALPVAPSQAPIDGGLTLLAAAGGGYAVKKLRDRKKLEDEIDP